MKSTRELTPFLTRCVDKNYSICATFARMKERKSGFTLILLPSVTRHMLLYVCAYVHWTYMRNVAGKRQDASEINVLIPRSRLLWQCGGYHFHSVDARSRTLRILKRLGADVV
jgi:hypothetical protein